MVAFYTFLFSCAKTVIKSFQAVKNTLMCKRQKKNGKIEIFCILVHGRLSVIIITPSLNDLFYVLYGPIRSDLALIVREIKNNFRSQLLIDHFLIFKSLKAFTLQICSYFLKMLIYYQTCYFRCVKPLTVWLEVFPCYKEGGWKKDLNKLR